MPTMRLGNDVFETGCEMLDVTSLHRPDTTWRQVDKSGHVHQWYVDGSPAQSYDPAKQYTTPTLVWVKDGEQWYDDDDEPHEIGHLECSQCGEHIVPRSTADTETRYIPGLRWCRINGESVSKDEFEARLKATSPSSPR